MFKRKIALTIGALGMAVALPGIAHACKLPAGYVSTPVPEITGKMISHTEETVIKTPMAVALRKRQNSSLSSVIAKTKDLPHVVGTRKLSRSSYGPKGSKRLVCLSDGGTAVEQVLVNKLANGQYRFKYIVWGYTSEAAKAVNYAVGEFIYSPLSSYRTKVKWTYSFALKKKQFPGNLGALGRGLFSASFLQPKYAPLMRGTLKNIKKQAEG